jgi:hypothetical protein
MLGMECSFVREGHEGQADHDIADCFSGSSMAIYQ